MAWSDIPTYITTIETAVYGKDMREAIADSIQELYNAGTASLVDSLTDFLNAEETYPIDINLNNEYSGVTGHFKLRYLGGGFAEYYLEFAFSSSLSGDRRFIEVIVPFTGETARLRPAEGFLIFSNPDFSNQTVIDNGFGADFGEDLLETNVYKLTIMDMYSNGSTIIPMLTNDQTYVFQGIYKTVKTFP